MQKTLMILFALFSTVAQAQTVLKDADQLLLNAEFDKVIALADGQSGSVTGDDKLVLINKKAEALIRLGKIKEADEELKTIKSKGTLFTQAVTESTFGLHYLYQGRSDLAMQELQNALRKFEESGKSNSLEAAQALAHLGRVYSSTGKAAQAEEQLRMSLSIREELLEDDHELIAASYNDLGLAYVDVDNDKALDYYEKAIKIYEKIHGNEHAKIALTNSNMGLVYRRMKLYGDAINDFETALKIWNNVYPAANPTKAFTLHNLGQTYAQMGNVDVAREFYTKALDIYRQSYGSKHPDIAQVLNDFGYLELTAGKFDIAIGHFQGALCANVSDFSNNDPDKNPKLENFYNGRVLLYSLLLKGKGFESRHFGKSLKLSDLKTSLAILQRCDTLIDKLRQQSTNESDKIALGAIASEVYADGVRISHEAAAGALSKRPFREQAFYFAEKSKSAVLLEAISESDAKSFAGIPENLLEEEKNLKSAIALTAQKLAQRPTPDEEKYLRETSFSLNRAYEKFVSELEKQYPSYFDLKYNSASPSIRQIQSLLDNKTALLSYFIDEQNQRLYNFVITHSTFKVVDHTLPKDFDKNITGFRNGIYFSAPAAFGKASNLLSDLLIPRLRASIKELVIVPTGRLGIIPFEALSLKKVKDVESFNNVDFLLKERSVRYEFSAGLMLQQKKQTGSQSTSIFLCAPVNFPAKDNLNELPGTESEVNAISSLFTSKNITSKLFTRLDANEHALKSTSLKEFGLIHFATHGVVDETSPELSRIFLQSSSEAEDGNLFAGEIYNLEMNADLVTLSACQTGLGKISKGEGVIGLSRALVYAGAKSIMVSFWSVADDSTSELMKNFYTHTLENPSAGYSNSLRDAKLKLMKDKKYSAPFYWAPFILIGF